MVATATQKYACTARTEFGARCRNWSILGTNRCAQHTGKGEDIGPPDAAEYKCNVNPNWVQRLRRDGVEERMPDYEAKIAAHIAQAEDVGRDAFRFRGDQGIEDSGVPVFGEEGLVDVNCYQLFRQLLEFYNSVDLSIQPMRPGKNQAMRKLVVAFFQGQATQKNVAALDSLLEFLSAGCQGHCHIWDNPRNKWGHNKSTVNMAHRQPDIQPKQVVHFNNGLWAVETVVA